MKPQFLFFGLVLGINALATAASAQVPVQANALFARDWAVGDVRDMVVRFAPCNNGQVCGVIVALGEPGEDGVGILDTANPNPALRGRRVCGLQMVTGLTRTSRGWTGGRAYDPTEGVTMGVNLSENRGQYQIRLIGIPFAGTLPLVPAPANPARKCT